MLFMVLPLALGLQIESGAADCPPGGSPLTHSSCFR